MKTLYRLFFVFGLALCLPFAVLAQDAAAPAPPPKPAQAAEPSQDKAPILKLFKDQGVTVAFIGQKFGLNGWLLTKGKSIQVIYTTLDGQGAVVGTLYGPKGELETGAQLVAAKQKGIMPSADDGSTPQIASVASAPAAKDAAAAPPSQQNGEAPSERLWKQAEASTYIKFGPDSAPPLYVIMDPRCHYCHDLYTSLAAKYLPANRLQLRVIPVGILGDSSVKEAAQIVSSPDMAKSWDQIEHYNVSELPKADGDADAKLQKNHLIMEDWNLTGTPAYFYRGKDGKVKIAVGIPNDLEAIVADLGPGQPN